MTVTKLGIIDSNVHHNPTRHDENREKMKRWRVEIKSKSNRFTIDEQVRYVEEIEELQDIVERGPDWRNLVEIKITYNL